VTLPTVYSLIPDLLILRHRLTVRLDVDVDAFRDAYYQLELLPHCLSAASLALENLISELQITVSDSLSSRPPESQAIILPKPEVTHRLSYHVDHFLDAARRTQNAWIPYLSRSFRLSLPHSLNDLMKRLKSRDLGLPEGIRRELTAYWECHGKRLKDYRDLAQHHALVLSEARISHTVDGSPSIWLTLPNNPGVKSSAQLSYEDPTVHAFFYIRDQYYELVAFSYRLCANLLEESSASYEASSPRVPPVVPRTWIGPPFEGHPIPTESVVTQEIVERMAPLEYNSED
jgi:hypothetical protein